MLHAKSTQEDLDFTIVHNSFEDNSLSNVQEVPVDGFFPTMYQEFIYLRTYSRWLDKEMRRETWEESVRRYQDFFKRRVPKCRLKEFDEVCENIFNLNVMPSMRALWTAGPALDRENSAGYNCSYLVINNLRAFAELLYLLMNGTGVGFSVERQYISKLPEVPSSLDKVSKKVIVADSKKGWAEAYLSLLKYLYSGKIPEWDTSKVRPVGARLKTFGGRASGPQVLEELFGFTVSIFEGAKGRRLNSVECHRLCCKVAAIVVVGGVRRSACISLTNPSDDRMKHIKSGKFWDTMPELSMANISAAWTDKPKSARFMDEWLSLIRSGSGERGIFNRQAANYVASLNGRRKFNEDLGCNPCSEILLRPEGFCNLTEVVCRPGDSLQVLEEKVRQATILGIIQSTLTKFKFINRMWRKNAEEERLLGVSLTGLMDHEVLSKISNKSKVWLTSMNKIALSTAEEWARAMDINMPAAISCVKPSGTVSQLVNSSSGLHARYSPYYIRNVRVARTDPICKLLRDQGVPNSPEVGQTEEDCSTFVFGFPVKSPESSVCRDEVGAIEQLEYWLMIQQHWAEHKASCTVYVQEDEWMDVGAWVYKNWNWMSGITFLPYDGGIYSLPPFDEISEIKYEEKINSFPNVDFSKLTEYEQEDRTDGSREYACAGGACEI